MSETPKEDAICFLEVISEKAKDSIDRFKTPPYILADVLCAKDNLKIIHEYTLNVIDILKEMKNA